VLAAIGRDCVGAVQLLPPDETPADIRKIDAHPLTPAAIAAELAGVTSSSPAGEITCVAQARQGSKLCSVRRISSGSSGLAIGVFINAAS